MSAASWCSARSRAAPACIRIPFGQGVCGAAAATLRGPAGRRRPRLSRPHRLRHRVGSELVVPIVRDGELLAVLDLDSPNAGAVRCRGRSGLRTLGEILATRTLAQLLEPLVAERARDDHHRARQLAGVVAGEIARPAGPDCPLGAAPSTSAATSSRSPI